MLAKRAGCRPHRLHVRGGFDKRLADRIHARPERNSGNPGRAVNALIPRSMPGRFRPAGPQFATDGNPAMHLASLHLLHLIAPTRR